MNLLVLPILFGLRQKKRFLTNMKASQIIKPDRPNVRMHNIAKPAASSFLKQVWNLCLCTISDDLGLKSWVSASTNSIKDRFHQNSIIPTTSLVKVSILIELSCTAT